MCGIAGYIGPERIPDAHAAACLALMRRRGPDAEGTYRHAGPGARHVLLLHSRLSIIDLDRHADQPLEAAGEVLVFNGEIYNYIELRQRLQAEGRTFRTSSDTEVLLGALAAWGGEATARCEGMWAFAHYEMATGRLLLSRDRFGEKPLFLYRDGTGLYFGSEVKFISALLGRELEPNVDHLLRYLVNGYKSLYKVRDTFFAGVTQLPAGHQLEIGAAGNENLRSYWQPTLEQDDAQTWEQAVEGARTALIASVRLRLRADVPIAFCMSGGVDSNALIAIAKRVFGYDVHGFTILNTDARYEEREMVDYSVRELGIRHTQIPLQPDSFLGRLRQLVIHHDAPVYTISYYVHWLLMQQVHAAGYRISVSGTGADELFTGYYDHHNLYLAGVRDEPATHAAALAAWLQWIAPLVRNPHLRDPHTFVKRPDERRHIYLDADKFASYLQRPWAEAFSETSYSRDLLRNRMLNELFHEAVPVILHEDDLNAMYYSVENRSPYLDSTLFRVCSSIPSRHLIRDGHAKAVLRAAMRGIVPDRILDNRRKVGFNAPLLDLLDVRNPAVRHAVLEESPVYELVSRERVAPLLEKGTLANSESKFLFNFLCVKLFLEQFASTARGLSLTH